MRIIAGEHRGRQLLPPEGDVTRPITVRVKQSLFDILTPRLADANVYDLFAGTGSMGLECLSRGAERSTFFEADRSAVVRLKQNIDLLKVADRSAVVSGDLFLWFDGAKLATNTDLIFLDPPYRFLRERPDDLRRLAAKLAEHLSPKGIVIFRHDGSDELPLPPLHPVDRREYGGMTIELLHRHGTGITAATTLPAQQ